MCCSLAKLSYRCYWFSYCNSVRSQQRTLRNLVFVHMSTLIAAHTRRRAVNEILIWLCRKFILQYWFYGERQEIGKGVLAMRKNEEKTFQHEAIMWWLVKRTWFDAENWGIMELGVEGRKLSSFDAIWRNLETLMPLKLGKSVFPTKITKLSFLSSTPLLPLSHFMHRGIINFPTKKLAWRTELLLRANSEREENFHFCLFI